jgi:hypothetical protein
MVKSASAPVLGDERGSGNRGARQWGSTICLMITRPVVKIKHPGKSWGGVRGKL